MTHLTRDEILARRVGQEVVTLADGSTVLVRGCTRRQAAQIQEAPDGEERDALMISFGLADPQLTPEDVLKWFAEAPNGDVLLVTAAVLRASGMADGQAKDATKSVPRRRGRS